MKKRPKPDPLATFVRKGLAAQQAVDAELAKNPKCQACGTKLEGVVAEPDREYLCPKCFSALTPDERRRGVVKRPSDAPTPRSTPAAKKLKGRS